MSQPTSHNIESPTKTILIAEDDENIITALSDYFERSGYNSILAIDGLEALELFRKNKPDLIITDLMMPTMHGLDLVTSIRRIDPLVPIIILTALDDIVDKVLGLEMGADDYITKPFSLRELEARVKAVLRRTREGPNPDSFRDESPIVQGSDRPRRSNLLLSHEKTRLETKTKEPESTQSAKTADMITEKDPAVFASIAHDMGNELTQIGGALETIRHLATDSNEINEECDLIERSLQYSGQLLRRLKNYTHIVKPHLEAFDISELIKRAETLIRPRIPSNIVFEVDSDLSTLEGKVLVDSDQVIGVLIEITNNAVHALRNTEGIIRLTANIQDDMFGIVVSNNGPQIPDNIREQLFEQRVRSSKEKGTGMGLFLANQVLSTFGGNISLTTPLTDWVTFKVQLPMYKE
jgi:DNA-binding response OmpR family regulator